MKIVGLKESPRKNGNSSWLSDQFAKSATKAGYKVVAFDCVRYNVGCFACNAYGMNGPCEPLLATDVIALAAPIYYFGKPTREAVRRTGPARHGIHGLCPRLAYDGPITMLSSWPAFR